MATAGRHNSVSRLEKGSPRSRSPSSSPSTTKASMSGSPVPLSKLTPSPKSETHAQGRHYNLRSTRASLEPSSDAVTGPTAVAVAAAKALRRRKQSHPPPQRPSHRVQASPLWKRDLLYSGLVFIASTVMLLTVLGFVYTNVTLPPAVAEQLSLQPRVTGVPVPPTVGGVAAAGTVPAPASRWQLITSLDDLKAISGVLMAYTQHNYGLMFLAHMVCFLWLQAFAIPGTIFFNLLGGALFGLKIGFPICLIYNTLGSVFLFLLSRHFGKRLVKRFFASRLRDFQALVQPEIDRGTIFIYMTSIRVFPFTPNWFVNVSSAQVNIPLGSVFVPALLVGLAPYNFLTCKAGLLLSQLTSQGDIIDRSTTYQLAAIALGGFLLPTLFKRFILKNKGKEAASMVPRGSH